MWCHQAFVKNPPCQNPFQFARWRRPRLPSAVIFERMYEPTSCTFITVSGSTLGFSGSYISPMNIRASEFPMWC